MDLAHHTVTICLFFIALFLLLYWQVRRWLSGYNGRNRIRLANRAEIAEYAPSKETHQRWNFVHDFTASSLSTKSQVVASLISSVALVVLTIQAWDNHQLATTTYRQLMATTHSSIMPANIIAVKAHFMPPTEYVNSEVSITVENIGGGVGKDIDAVAYLATPEEQTVSGGTSWSEMVPGEDGSLRLDPARDFLKDDSVVIVRTRFWYANELPTQPKHTSCSEFKFKNAWGADLRPLKCE